MKINRKTSPSINKKILLLILIPVAIIGLSLTYVYGFDGNILGWKNSNESHNTTPSDTSGNKPASEEQKDAGEQAGNPPVTTPPAQEAPPKSGNNQTQDTRTTVAVSITAAQQDGDIVLIRTIINSIENDGQCTLRISQPGKTTVVKTAQVQTLPTNSTCQGFNVPVSELSPGAWTAEISYSSAKNKGSSSQEITIR